MTELHPGAPGPTIDDPRRRRAVLVAVCVALMAVIASVTGLNVAQPELAVDLDASQSTVLWFINLYTLTLAALLLPMGALGDRRGRRTVLLAGLVLFGIANVAAALATTSELMLAARFLSGAGAAMIMPVTLAVITSTFPAEDRATGIGVWTAVAGGGGLLGMVVSALLVDLASWRWLFALPVALVVAALVLVLRAVPDSREHTPYAADRVGALTSATAVLGVVYALHEGPVHGWTEPLTLLALVTGALAAVAFVVVELRQEAPLLDVRLLRTRRPSTASVALLAVFGVQAGILVVLFPFLQAVLGWSALRATLAMLPMAVLMMAAAGLAPRLVAAVGSRGTMVAGTLLVGGGLGVMATLVSVDGGYVAVLPGLLALGLGMGLVMTPATEAITCSLPREQQGIASALNDVTRELGTALGVALLGAVLSAGYRHAVDERLDGVPPAAAAAAREGLANGIAAAEGLGPQADAVVLATQESFVVGWQQAMGVGAAVMAALCLLLVVRGERR